MIYHIWIIFSLVNVPCYLGAIQKNKNQKNSQIPNFEENRLFWLGVKMCAPKYMFFCGFHVCFTNPHQHRQLRGPPLWPSSAFGISHRSHDSLWIQQRLMQSLTRMPQDPAFWAPNIWKLNNQTDRSSCWSSGAKSAWAVLWQSKCGLSSMIDIEPATTLVDEPPQKRMPMNIPIKSLFLEPGAMLQFRILSTKHVGLRSRYTALHISATWDSTSQKQVEGIGPKFPPRGWRYR